MEIFLDTANLDEIRTAHRWGILAGVTTNPSLMAKEGVELAPRIRAIAELVEGPVSAEVTAVTAEGMVEEGRELAAIHPGVVVKVPVTPAGLQATAELARQGIDVNVTLVFNPNQALLAARAGAAYVSPFVGRLDDVGHDGVGVVAECVHIFERHGLTARIIAASLRHPRHVIDVARAGAHIGTLPFAVLNQMIAHPLTDIGLEKFLQDWRRAQQEGRAGEAGSDGPGRDA